MIEYHDTAYGRVPLPAGIRSRVEANGNGLRMHFLETGFEERGRPCALLLHGFPELAYSWRHVMPALAQAGFHVIAPDQRGYSPGARPADVEDYALPLLVQDVLALADAVGAERVGAGACALPAQRPLVGHYQVRGRNLGGYVQAALPGGADDLDAARGAEVRDVEAPAREPEHRNVAGDERLLGGGGVALEAEAGGDRPLVHAESGGDDGPARRKQFRRAHVVLIVEALSGVYRTRTKVGTSHIRGYSRIGAWNETSG